MTILNIHIKKDDKVKFQELVDLKKLKSMSDVIRRLVSEKIKIEEISRESKKDNEIAIPDYIPKNKYVAFIKGAIISVGDTVSEVAQVAAEKFPNGPLVIKFNGPKKKPIEYCFLSLNDLNCWNYANVENIAYPIIPITLQLPAIEKHLLALIDTAASVCLLKEGLIDISDVQINREEQLSTAAGIISRKFYKGQVKLLEVDFEIDFIIAPIDDSLPFNMLVGRNLLNKLDAYFFGKKKIVCLKIAED
jgi:predicted CopG family antitoxin